MWRCSLEKCQLLAAAAAGCLLVLAGAVAAASRAPSAVLHRRLAPHRLACTRGRRGGCRAVARLISLVARAQEAVAQVFVSDRLSSITACAACCLLLAACCLLPAACCLLLAACCLLPVAAAGGGKSLVPPRPAAPAATVTRARPHTFLSPPRFGRAFATFFFYRERAAQDATSHSDLRCFQSTSSTM